MLRWFIRIILLIIIFSGVIWFTYEAHSNPWIQEVILSGGYSGMFVFAFLNGFNVVAPFVVATLVPGLSAAGLNTNLLILFITTGVTLADMTSFFLGSFAAKASQSVETKMSQHIAHIKRMPPWTITPIVLGWAMLAPFPNEVILFPLGFLGYRWQAITLLVFTGNAVFNTAVSYGLITILAQFTV